jgi:hypothetical protein
MSGINLTNNYKSKSSNNNLNNNNNNNNDYEENLNISINAAKENKMNISNCDDILDEKYSALKKKELQSKLKGVHNSDILENDFVAFTSTTNTKFKNGNVPVDENLDRSGYRSKHRKGGANEFKLFDDEEFNFSEKGQAQGGNNSNKRDKDLRKELVMSKNDHSKLKEYIILKLITF